MLTNAQARFYSLSRSELASTSFFFFSAHIDGVVLNLSFFGTQCLGQRAFVSAQ